jgi:hypothetical protein
MAVVSETNRGMNRIDNTGTVNVAVSTLDIELAGKTLPVRFLKVDAEGHGAKVIMGAKSIIERDRPVIAIEIDEEPSHETANLLASMGYIAKSCHNATPTWIFEHHTRS